MFVVNMHHKNLAFLCLDSRLTVPFVVEDFFCLSMVVVKPTGFVQGAAFGRESVWELW